MQTYLFPSADAGVVDGDEPASPVVRGNYVGAASSINLYTDVRLSPIYKILHPRFIYMAVYTM